MDDGNIPPMKTTKYVYWEESGLWLGSIEEFSDHLSQGAALEELQANLKDIYEDITAGKVPGVRHVAELQVA